MSDTPSNDRARLMRLIDGFVTTQLVYVVEKLGIAEQLEAGPKTAADLAAPVGANPARLHRVLRDLVVEQVFDELDDRRFALTSIGRHLRELKALTIVRAEVQAAMADRSAQEAADVVASYDFARFERIVDVGGGRGVLLAAILESAPGLRGVLFDREAAIAAAQDHLSERGLKDRVDCIGGDFFTHVPTGADAYVLSRILHDWDDDDAERILRSCHHSMRHDSRLLVVDAVLPERAREPSRDPYGPPHARPLRCARANRGGVPTALRTSRLRVRGRRDDGVADEPGRRAGPAHVRSRKNCRFFDQHGAEFRHACGP